jgi:hypothetical protein
MVKKYTEETMDPKRFRKNKEQLALLHSINLHKQERDDTSIRVMRNTKKRFDACGIYGESADDILNRLIDREVKALEKHGRVRRYFDDARRAPGTLIKIVDAEQEKKK